MASGTIARSLFEDRLRRDDDAEAGAAKFNWSADAKRRLEARRQNAAMGRGTNFQNRRKVA